MLFHDFLDFYSSCAKRIQCLHEIICLDYEYPMMNQTFHWKKSYSKPESVWSWRHSWESSTILFEGSIEVSLRDIVISRYSAHLLFRCTACPTQFSSWIRLIHRALLIMLVMLSIPTNWLSYLLIVDTFPIRQKGLHSGY